MEMQLKVFEEYISSLNDRGVFPTFHRYKNGWNCVLRNKSDIQIMPFNESEKNFADTMLKSLILAVEKLNNSFSNPYDLFNYIDTGRDNLLIESLLQSVESLNETKISAYASV